MADRHTILAINPGSTSTKLALFHDETEVESRTLTHSAEDLATYDTIGAQVPLREAAIEGFIREHGIDVTSLAAVVGRGGLLRPLPGGVYEVGEAMLRDLVSGRYGVHASNLGGVLARSVAERARCRAFIADPVVVDELDDIARLSGHPALPRRSIFHALNQKSAAREACTRIGRRYETSSLIVAHLGGGVSVGAHRDGRVVDVNNALDGEGPFSPERAGTLPAGRLVDLAFSGDYDRATLRRMITGGGGVVAYCGTNDLRELTRRVEAGDAEADLVRRAMCYQIAREIASHGATFNGPPHAIVLTGGMAHDEHVVELISERVEYLAPIVVIPGEREMVSLAAAALAAIRGECEVRTYD